MDITNLFRASVKTARLRDPTLPPLDKQRILGKSTSTTPKSEFAQKTLNIRHQITQLKNLLLENRAAYMRFGYHLKSASQMSDTERDIIDAESENILTICTQFIGDLREECNRMTVTSKQCHLHRDSVLEVLSDYLRSVHRIYQQQKEYRVRHELDTYRLLKLESNKKLIPVLPARDKADLPDVPSSTTSDDEDNGRNGASIDDVDDDDFARVENDDHNDVDNDSDDNNKPLLSTNHSSLRRHQRPKHKHDNNAEDKRCIRFASMSSPDRPERHNHKQRQQPYRSTFDEDYGTNRFELDADEISADDIQMYESENHLLYNEFKGLSHEVEQIEKNVVDIAKLQDIFTEKVSVIILSMLCLETKLNCLFRFILPTGHHARIGHCSHCQYGRECHRKRQGRQRTDQTGDPTECRSSCVHSVLPVGHVV